MKNTSIMAGAISVAVGILAFAVMTMPLQPSHAVTCRGGEVVPFPSECPEAQVQNASCGGVRGEPITQAMSVDPPKHGVEGNNHIAIGGGGECMSGGAGGAGGEGGQAGTNIVKDTQKDKDAYQDANGGKSNGGYGGNASGGNARS
jgi:hypothetical protein